MERLIKFGRTIRNNWKKSIVGTIALYYGAAKVKEKYEINILMRAACKEAVKYGESLIPIDRNPTLITVILNPVANGRRAKSDFEKYCEPLLHLAGLQVDVIQTTSEGNAKEIMETLKGTEAIIVAGGDGTVSETVTGLLRRNDDSHQFPLGILPLGRTNTLADTMFPGGKGVKKVQQLIDASMAIIKGNTEWKDVMKIEPIHTEDEQEAPSKPVYALTSIEWGAFRDAFTKRDDYWFYGPFREYASYVFNGYKKTLNWDCKGELKFSPPCTGCTNCIVKKQEPPKRWFHFISNTKVAAKEEPNNINPQCQIQENICFKTCDFRIQTPNVENVGPIPALKIVIWKPDISYTEFVTEGWNRIKVKNPSYNGLIARTIEFIPQIPQDKDITISIDHEEFDVKPIKITLIPKTVKLFCKKEINFNDV